MRVAATILILLALAYRVLPTMDMTWANFPPMMAIAFCGAVYFKNRALRWLPFAGLCITDLYINWFYAREYGYHMEISAYVARAACFAAGLGLGTWIARQKSWLWLLNGTVLGALLFYIVTNTQSWWGDAFYAKTLAGWWQALTVGHPEYPPTILFFRNTLLGDLLFTGLFSGVMEWIARSAGEPSLLDEEEEEEPAQAGEPEPIEIEREE